MATIKMTFSLPEPLASDFLKSVPARKRSHYVADALAAKLRLEDEELARACEVANQEPDVLALEQEFDAISSDIAEPWSDGPAR